MSYTRVRSYLFTKSYAYTVFQNYIDKAKRKEKQRLKKRLSKVLLLKFSTPKTSDFHSLIRHNGKLSIYVRIEQELIHLMKERKERGYFDLVEYEYALLEPAIERVVGEDLSDIENDREFDEQLLRFRYLYTSWYYQIAAKYRLPTMRIVPFLLRLLEVKRD